MNPGTIVPLPIAAGEVVADRARGVNQGGAAEDGDTGEFLRLVAQLGQDPGRRGRSDAALPGETGEGVRLNLGAKLVGDIEVPRDESEGGERDPGEAQALPQRDALALQLALAGVGDPEALVRLLAAGAGPDQSLEAAEAVVARVANGSATATDIELVRAALTAAANGEMPSIPDATLLASLAKASSQASARRAGQPTPETMGKVAVLGRETHLAPVHAILAAGQEPSVSRAPHPVDAADVVLAIHDVVQASDDVVQASDDASLAAEFADPQPPVTAVRDARWGSRPQQDGAPLNLQQPMPEAAAGDEALASSATFQPASAVRADAPSNAAAAGSVMHQIANRVSAEASTMLGQATRPDAPTPSLGQHLGSPVKVIHLELQPEGLGRVSIRLAVKDQELNLALEVSRGDTATLIQRDRDTLSSLLRSAGYLIDGVDVRMAAPSGLAAAPMDGQPGMQMSAGAHSRGSQPEDRSPGATPQDNSRGSNNPANRHNGEDDQNGRNRGRGGGLYI